jgi:hypothetical protein
VKRQRVSRTRYNLCRNITGHDAAEDAIGHGYAPRGVWMAVDTPAATMAAVSKRMT